MSSHYRIYLAGPEVFFPESEHQAIVAEKKRLLEAYGFEGVDPLDTDLEFPEQESKPDRGLRIYRANRELMDSCHAIIANLTPFRGISADPGTVLEVGYMIGQGKPAFGFTMDNRHYRERSGGVERDSLGHSIEDFDLSDNLMIECSIREAGGKICTSAVSGEHQYFSSKLFSDCIKQMANQFLQYPPNGGSS